MGLPVTISFRRAVSSASRSSEIRPTPPRLRVSGASQPHGILAERKKDGDRSEEAPVVEEEHADAGSQGRGLAGAPRLTTRLGGVCKLALGTRMELPALSLWLASAKSDDEADIQLHNEASQQVRLQFGLTLNAKKAKGRLVVEPIR